MRSDSIFVRARDGALYLDPVLVFPEGFVCFSSQEATEVVLWLESDLSPPGKEVSRREAEGEGVDLILQRRLGRSLSIGSACIACLPALRVVPGSDPWEYRPAISYFVDIVARIPRPQRHDGTIRYPRDRGAAAVADWPMHRDDPNELDMPEG